MFKKVFNFVSEAKLELKKVAWTPKEEIASSTKVVIVSVILLTIYVSVVGKVLEMLMSFLIKLAS